MRQLAHLWQGWDMRSISELTLTFTERLVVARKRAGLSQSDMGILLGIGRRTISRYETELDPHTPIRAITIAWAYVTEAPLEWLEFGTVTSPDGVTGIPREWEGIADGLAWADECNTRSVEQMSLEFCAA